MTKQLKQIRITSERGSHSKLYFVGNSLLSNTDNQGSVDIYRKGHSTKCVYTSTVAKAIFDIAEAIGVTVSVEKIRRCSDRGSYTADQISKGNLKEMRRMMPLRDRAGPCAVPASIISWIRDPKEDMRLGQAILEELKRGGAEVITPY